jgi:hypothetical protein
MDKHKKTKKILIFFSTVILLCLFFGSSSAYALPAFPGAEGWGSAPAPAPPPPPNPAFNSSPAAGTSLGANATYSSIDLFANMFSAPASTSGSPSSAPRVKDILLNVLKWMATVFGILALIGFIISGIQYLMAMGSEAAAMVAKKNVTYSILGVIVGLSGYIIIKAVQAALTAGPI